MTDQVPYRSLVVWLALSFGCWATVLAILWAVT